MRNKTVFLVFVAMALAACGAAIAPAQPPEVKTTMPAQITITAPSQASP
ncbi:MAG: hypothetical protein WAU96_14200 [Anaerolineae bacterium]